MFDTLSAAMHKRPLTVSLEDSDLPAIRNIPGDFVSRKDQAPPEDIWDEQLCSRQRGSEPHNITRWPCSYEEATTFLTSAAPVKVLLFRRVTRIQTLIARRVHGAQLDEAIQKSLQLCNHWRKQYAPFIQDCLEHHGRLPARIQSWYICLASHWHLAALLLVDLIEIVDESELGGQVHREDRIAAGFVSSFRLLHCCMLSDIARCACPPEIFGWSDSQSSQFPANGEAILTEPWIMVLVRAFATAGVLLLGIGTPSEQLRITQRERFFRVSHCWRALQYIGQRCDTACAAANLLGVALSGRKDRADNPVDRAVPGIVRAELRSQETS
jgi:hypothetical protein